MLPSAPIVAYPAFTCAVLLAVSNLFMTLAVFVPFAVPYMGARVKCDYLWAGLCLMGAGDFIFR